ncbi:uncharacterized protein LOC106758331 [Vigna radiata var. radiata]|uniref:Uncharacterized protein LOC106758331 n=1 Tax=Vigna radiata var. radiata TaxID=3916 RepID=A0A1S3TSK1_VIGRR|nr:uncharacterized protein LOC106758331 [Vigna radiata var. radiata]
MATLFGKLREHELELGRLKDEEEIEEKKSIALKATSKKASKSEDNSDSEMDNNESMTMKMLPLKFKDLGSFTIPCTIRNYDIGKALVDFGANINLLPLSMLEKIGGLEVKPTKAVLQMVDRSIKHPYGLIKDVVVKIDKLKFLVDFVGMEMEENEQILIILG